MSAGEPGSRGMRAPAVLVERPGEVTLTDVELGEPGEGDVLIRTLVSGVSTGTDRWVVTGRFEWGAFEFPLVPGYQRIGVVAAIGESVSSLSPGDVVFATSSRDFVDASAGWGAHAAWAISPEVEVFPAQGVPALSGSLAVSLQVGVNAAARLVDPDGARILVVGDGIIGTSAALAAQLRGARVLLAGHRTQRLAAIAASQRAAEADLARADRSTIECINSHEDWASHLAEWQPTSVIDTVQSAAVTSDYLRFLPCTWNGSASVHPRHGSSQIVFAGHSPDGITCWADMAGLQQQEATVHFVSGWTRTRMHNTLELLRNGDLVVDSLISEIALGDSMTEFLGQLADGSVAPVAACLRWADD